MLQELEEATQMKGRFKYAENAGDTVFNLQPYVYWFTAHIAASPSGAVAKDMKTESYIFSDGESISAYGKVLRQHLMLPHRA